MSSRRTRRAARLFLSLFFLITTLLLPAEQITSSAEDQTKLQVHFLDVGQGDCTLIQTKDHAMLIDAGNNDKGTYVQNYLKKQGIEKLDYVIGTHPDADHIGGLDVVLTKFDCETVIMPERENNTKTYRDVVQVMKQKRLKRTVPKAGQEYILGDARFTITSPVKEDYGDNNNDYSVGILLQYGDTRFLFTGDAEEESEKDMEEGGGELSADVYKAAHHGSRSASTEAFMNAVNPQYAVISCGEGNSYGHPHSEVLNRFRQMGIQVFRTDEQGTIIAETDGSSVTWNCQPSVSWQAGDQTKSDQEKSSEKSAGKSGYVLNTNTKKFHKSSCKSVKRISEKNKKKVKTDRSKLVSEGYSPCKQCNP